jgi:hypothetical protein
VPLEDTASYFVKNSFIVCFFIGWIFLKSNEQQTVESEIENSNQTFITNHGSRPSRMQQSGQT